MLYKSKIISKIICCVYTFVYIFDVSMIFAFIFNQITLWILILALILLLAIIPNVFQLIMSMELYSMIETNWRMIRKVMALPEMIRPKEEVSLDGRSN